MESIQQTKVIQDPRKEVNRGGLYLEGRKKALQIKYTLTQFNCWKEWTKLILDVICLH